MSRLNEPLGTGETGATSVEFSLSVGIFLAALIFFTDMVQISFRMVTAQYVASQAVRTAIVTSAAPRGEIPTCEDRLQSIQAISTGVAESVGLSGVSSQNVYICPASPQHCTINNPGKAKELIQLEIEVPIRIFFLHRLFSVRARALGRNESYVSCT